MKKVVREIAYENRVENSIAVPDSSDDLFTFLKIMFRGNQEIQEAIEHYTEAIPLDPDGVIAYHRRGTTYGV